MHHSLLPQYSGLQQTLLRELMMSRETSDNEQRLNSEYRIRKQKLHQLRRDGNAFRTTSAAIAPPIVCTSFMMNSALKR